MESYRPDLGAVQYPNYHITPSPYASIEVTNLQSVMEYRVSFLTQTIGMMLNNFMYFASWIIFFQRFKDVRGWCLSDMYVTYGILPAQFRWRCKMFLL